MARPNHPDGIAEPKPGIAPQAALPRGTHTTMPVNPNGAYGLRALFRPAAAKQESGQPAVMYSRLPAYRWQKELRFSYFAMTLAISTTLLE